MLTLLFILNAAVAAPAADIPELTAPEVRISVHPSFMDSYQLLKRKTPQTYTCTAFVMQAETHIGYLKAELVVSSGTTEKVSKKFGEYGLDFAVTVKNQMAETVVTVKRGDRVLTRQSSTVSLNIQDARVVPAD